MWNLIYIPPVLFFLFSVFVLKPPPLVAGYVYLFSFIGIEVSTPSGVHTVKAALVAISCDLPARALVLNMRQFNGAQACHLCEDNGQTSATNHLLRWWPPNPSSVLRTKESLSADAIKATTEGAIVSEHACSILRCVSSVCAVHVLCVWRGGGGGGGGNFKQNNLHNITMLI